MAAKKRSKDKAATATKGIPENRFDNITETTVNTFTAESMKVYGSYVVEERAVPDFRDGLKPVHRAILWSLAGLGLRPDKGYKKSARAIGEVIGKYHPHGDAAAYGAMVTIANTEPPAVDGQGNWGTPINMAASMRYTECRMSKFAHKFLLDPKYLSVVPYVPNFSDDDKIPLYLPALLPYLMFNGSTPAPAYGVRAGNPSFTFESVAKVVTAMLKGKELTAKRLAKNLKIDHTFGCLDVTSEDVMQELVETGKGSVVYAPKIDTDYKQRKILIQSFVPGSLSTLNGVDKTLAKLRNIQGVSKCFSKQGKKSVGSGAYGALFIVETPRNVGEEAFYDIAEAVEKAVTGSVSYRLGITIRKEKTANKFKYLSYVDYLNAWVKYRVQLELRLIKKLLETAEKDLHINEVYLFAVENMEKLLKVLPKVLVAKDPDAALAAALKMPVEDAKIILDRKVRQLARLEAADLKAKIKQLKDEIKQLKRDKKDPGARAAADTQKRVSEYMKSPDAYKSGRKLKAA